MSSKPPDLTTAHIPSPSPSSSDPCLSHESIVSTAFSLSISTSAHKHPRPSRSTVKSFVDYKATASEYTDLTKRIEADLWLLKRKKETQDMQFHDLLDEVFVLREVAENYQMEVETLRGDNKAILRLFGGGHGACLRGGGEENEDPASMPSKKRKRTGSGADAFQYRPGSPTLNSSTNSEPVIKPEPQPSPVPSAVPEAVRNKVYEFLDNYQFPPPTVQQQRPATLPTTSPPSSPSHNPYNFTPPTFQPLYRLPGRGPLHPILIPPAGAAPFPLPALPHLPLHVPAEFHSSPFLTHCPSTLSGLKCDNYSTCRGFHICAYGSSCTSRDARGPCRRNHSVLPTCRSAVFGGCRSASAGEGCRYGHEETRMRAYMLAVVRWLDAEYRCASEIDRFVF
ncbi:hypothetical protein K402DRAFT_467566 [Aulographum hederae CBS 113979]|uniref:Uncharacterized protein n=1 Tax=Aulographum hederae CBS 113979 TaxID=1176131 RepID=A0A6G1GKM8_9PEZI|nr:hypothetical protein K402DRAFT_467566 [Aulographum hederae CBS 113979]